MSTASFIEKNPADPAIPGDPFAHVRFHYGQLLGAAEFSTEQRAFLWADRIHQAFTHGYGTVIGLATHAQGRDSDGKDREIAISQGFAVDGVGRTLFNDKTLCFDVSALDPRGEFLRGIQPIETGEVTVWRCYAVLRYSACLGNPIPGIRPPCNEASDDLIHSRSFDRIRVDLVERMPTMPHWLHPDWLREVSEMLRHAHPPRDLRAALLEVTTRDVGDLTQMWRAAEEAGVLLACVELAYDRTQRSPAIYIRSIDESVRPILPPVQLLGEQAFGHRLVGPDHRGGRLRLVSVADLPHNKRNSFRTRLRFTHPVNEATVPEGIRIYRLQADGWKRQHELHFDWESPTEVAVGVESDATEHKWRTGTTYQVEVRGGCRPLLSKVGTPFAGWVDDPMPGHGRGLDANIVRNWNPGQ